MSTMTRGTLLPQALAMLPPPATAFTVGVIVGCTLFQFALMDERSTNRLTLSAISVLDHGEWYRLVTSGVLHGGVMHLAANVASTAMIGGVLERQHGSARLMVWTLWALPLCSLMYCLISALVALLLQDRGWARQRVLGFSGVIFCFAVQEAWKDETRTVFGLKVPARLSPVVMLLAMQILVPNVSFIGHLAGLAVGLLKVQGAFDFLMPSHAFFISSIDPTLARLPSYVPDPVPSLWRDNNQERIGLCSLAVKYTRYLADFLCVATGLESARERLAGVITRATTRRSRTRPPPSSDHQKGSKDKRSSSTHHYDALPNEQAEAGRQADAITETMQV